MVENILFIFQTKVFLSGHQHHTSMAIHFDHVLLYYYVTISDLKQNPTVTSIYI